MPLLTFIFIMVMIGVALYLVDRFVPMNPTIKQILFGAVFIGVIVIGGLLFIKQRQPNIDIDPQGWVYQNVTKKVSTEKIDEFVKLAEDETANDVEENDATKQAEIKELMKDVSEKEIQDFLNDAVALSSNDDTDALMN